MGKVKKVKWKRDWGVYVPFCPYGGSNSFAPLVAFHIEQKAKELLEGEDICKNIHQKK